MSDIQTLNRVGTLMARVRRVILDASDFSDGLNQALAQVCQAMSLNGATLLQTAPENKATILADCWLNEGQSFIGRSFVLNPNTQWHRLLSQGQCLLLSDISSDEEEGFAGFVKARASKIGTIYPLMSKNGLSGLLCLHPKESSESSEEMKAVAQFIAEEMLLLLNQQNLSSGSSTNPAYSMEDLTRQLSEERLMRHIISKLHLSLDKDVILQTAVDCLGRALSATFCLVVRADMPIHAQVTHEYADAASSPLGLGRTEHLPANIVSCFKQRTAAIGSMSGQMPFNELGQQDMDYWRANDIKTLLGTPITFHGVHHGVLLVLDCRRARAFSESEIVVLETVAQQAAISVNHADLLAQIKDQLYKMNVITTLTQQLTTALEMVGHGSRPQTDEEGKAIPAIRLSQREMEVLRLIAQGLANREIAQRLFLTESTVELHASRIRKKLKLKSRTALVKYACDNHLV
ncbi:MAG: LuxR C-terminal-related transcriptional regulator [Candidatus Obscuribacterales bacterium]|nr:LuxR C-terminal-related transcriptional regulator [Candidatus Obscuribacterales bacterium]